MAKQHMLSLATVASVLGGKIGQAFDEELERAYNDVKGRPSVAGKRTVKLTIELAPLLDDTGALETVDAGFKIASATPGRAAMGFRMLPKPKGVAFIENSADARQPTFADIDEDEKGG